MKIEIESMVLGMVSTNVYIVGFEGKCIIIDPADEAGKIISQIESKGLKPCGVLLTHGHFDHAMAAEEIAERYGIKIYAGEAEKELLEDSSLNMGMRFARKDFKLTADVTVKDGDELDFEGLKLRVISTPGHTSGSVSFYTENPENSASLRKVIFTGDAIFAGSIGRCDLPTGDDKVMRNTLDTVFKVMDEDVTVLSGHGRATTIAKELAGNPYLR